MRGEVENMPIYGFVYKITNSINGMVYVGQHMGTDFGGYWGSGQILKKAYEKYGKDVFTREILEYAFTKQDLNSLECHYIETLNTLAPYGYNIATGGKGGYTGETTEESIKKIKAALVGKPKSLEHRLKISKAKKGKTSHPQTEETRAKISNSHIGIKPWNKGKGKAIEQLTMQGEHIQTWSSLTDACLNGGFNKSKISECLHGKRKHHKHFVWRLLDG